MMIHYKIKSLLKTLRLVILKKHLYSVTFCELYLDHIANLVKKNFTWY